MTINGWSQILIFFAVVTALTPLFGLYMTRVLNGELTWASPILQPVERLFYALAGIDPRREQRWTTYGAAMLVFSAAGFATLYLLMRIQDLLPLNPQGFAAVQPDLAMNTAISFVTNTNWQNYAGEATMSYLTQMLGLAVHNFVSAATGIALAMALIRGFSRNNATTLGNFWVDLTRTTLYILLPVAIITALIFISEGVPQTLGAYIDATTLEGGKQTIAVGPVASQLVIKMFGTNGGGFFNANSAHPFENPTALTNFLQMVMMFAIGAALTNVFGRMMGNQRQGWALFGAMAVLFLAGAGVLYQAEVSGNPTITAMGVDGPNMEGKETRFGIANSALFATITTDTSSGAVNNMHDSLTPIGGLVPIVNMMLGEVVFGGVGSGLYGILLYAIVAVFIAGLMVGRTPEYGGKKIEQREVKMTMLAILCLPLSILGFSAVATVLPDGLAGPANAGPHGFTEILYAYTSATANNGSAFGGLSGNTLFYNVTLGLAMIIGRFAFIVPMLAVAGALAAKGRVPPSAGTFPTDDGMFVALLVGIIVIVGGLTFFPALALGPVAEHFAMLTGASY
jgi:K+-transporting ATPase ATPase A chain